MEARDEATGREGSTGLKHLGQQVTESQGLEVVPRPRGTRGTRVELSRVRLDCSEFTSHCPVTGQPDFAEVVIEYVPGDHIVETKSVKLWLQTWRSRSAFNEQIAVELLHAFVEAVNPISASVVARFKPRGGISVTATATTSNLA